MSIADPATPQKREEKEISDPGVRSGKSDDRMRMQGKSNKQSDHSATNSHKAKLDIDFLPPWNDELLRRASHPDRGHSSLQQHHYDHEMSREYIFGQVETLRGLGKGGIGGHDEADRPEALFDNGTNRMQRRLAALPILEKYVFFLTVFPSLPNLPVRSSIDSLPLSVCIWRGVYGSVLRAVHRAMCSSPCVGHNVCTPTHPTNPLLGFPGN